MTDLLQCPTCGNLIAIDQPLLDREHRRLLEDYRRESVRMQTEMDQLRLTISTIGSASLTAAAQKIGARMADYAERQEAATTRGERSHYRIRALETLSIVETLTLMAKGA